MKILNIASGKFKPIPLNGDNLSLPQYILNVDTSYYDGGDGFRVEQEIKDWEEDPDRINKNFYLNTNIFEFMERTRTIFDRVVIYRFLEHVSFTQVEYFIYLVSTVLNKYGIVDIIVPDYTILAELLLAENNYTVDPKFNFQAHNILLTTEMLNEPSCPHASIWTSERMKRFWELEGRFRVLTNQIGFNFDGRDIYLRSLIQRI